VEGREIGEKDHTQQIVDDQVNAPPNKKQGVHLQDHRLSDQSEKNRKGREGANDLLREPLKAIQEKEPEPKKRSAKKLKRAGSFLGLKGRGGNEIRGSPYLSCGSAIMWEAAKWEGVKNIGAELPHQTGGGGGGGGNGGRRPDASPSNEETSSGDRGDAGGLKAEGPKAGGDGGGKE